LSAFVDAWHLDATSSRPSVPSVRRDVKALYEPLCCDNFA
jgi:hypothetical protein